MHAKYAPSGRFTPVGLVLMPVLGLLGALVGSYIYYLFDKHLFTLIILFPAILGAIAGGGVGLGVLYGKVRYPLLAGVIAVLLGAFAYVMVHYWSYRALPGELAEAYKEETGIELSAAQSKDLTDWVLEEEVGQTGFVGYIKLTAEEGVSVGRAGSSSNFLKLPAFLAYPLLLVEMLISAGVAGMVAGSMASDLFCERDNLWYKTRDILKSSGTSAQAIAEAIEAGQYDQIPELIEPPQKALYSQVKVKACPRCRDAYLSLDVSRENKSTTVYTAHLTPEQLNALEAAVASGKPGA